MRAPEISQAKARTMWFKNLRIYRLSEGMPCAIEELEERLATCSFVPCGKSDSSRMGWVPPMGPSAIQLLHSAGDFHLLCARTQQKLLPPGAIKEQLEEKILVIESAESRKLGRRERSDLKDELIQSLLPRALTRSHHDFAILVPRRDLLLIDSASPARAEDLLNLLRNSLGRLPVKPLVPNHSPVDLMTRWIAGARLPKHFRLGQHCDLRDPLHAGNVVRCRAQELATQEVRGHLDAGKQAYALGLDWHDRLQFVLHEDLSLKGIKYGEIVQRDPGLDEELDEAALFDADFVLMSLELDKLSEELLEIFGSAEV